MKENDASRISTDCEKAFPRQPAKKKNTYLRSDADNAECLDPQCFRKRQVSLKEKHTGCQDGQILPDIILQKARYRLHQSTLEKKKSNRSIGEKAENSNRNAKERTPLALVDSIAVERLVDITEL